MAQVITRMDDELAAALKAQARSVGVSVNEYVTRLVRVAVGGPDSTRRAWKAAGVASGLLMDRPSVKPPSPELQKLLPVKPKFPPDYRNLVVEERDEHR
jgi:hypothetical protein